MTFSDTRKSFRRRLESPRIIVAPGVGDAMGARFVAAAGFEAVYMSGYAVEGTFGKPDVGLLSLSEMAGRAAQIADVAGVPVLADADTGYGNAINVIRTVREFERAGVTAIQLEDQALPKKCGSMEGKRLVSTQEMIGKLKAAVDSRHDENLLVIGRTDIVASEGIPAAIDRLGAYADAGADILMALGPYDEVGAARIIKASGRPFLYLNSETFTMAMMPASRLEEIGVRLVAFPLALTLSAARAMQDTLAEIARAGTTKDHVRSAMISSEAFNQAMGIAQIHADEQRYGARAALSREHGGQHAIF